MSFPRILPVTSPDWASLRRAYRWLYAVPVWQSGMAVLGVITTTAVLAWCSAGQPFSAVTALLIVLLSAATLTDLLWKRIFHWVPVGILMGITMLHTVAPAGSPWTGLPSAIDSLRGFLFCGGLMIAFYLLFQGGEGDVKLVATLGAALGPWHGSEAILFGYMTAAGVALPLLIVRRAGSASRTLPMAPFFSWGTFLTLALPNPEFSTG